MRILAYKRTAEAVWVAVPRTTAEAAQRFLVQGTWAVIRYEDASGEVRHLLREASNGQAR